MSKTTAALEAQVSIVIENTPKGEEKPTARPRANVDKAFAAILKLIAPRIRHFIRQYGLTNHWDDAEQACAIGVHRAIQAYDPAKAQFTTFVNWQLRGELQGLRCQRSLQLGEQVVELGAMLGGKAREHCADPVMMLLGDFPEMPAARFGDLHHPGAAVLRVALHFEISKRLELPHERGQIAARDEQGLR